MPEIFDPRSWYEYLRLIENDAKKGPDRVEARFNKAARTYWGFGILRPAIIGEEECLALAKCYRNVVPQTLAHKDITELFENTASRIHAEKIKLCLISAPAENAAPIESVPG